MIQAFHDKAKGILAWSIIVVITLAFASWGVGDFLSRQSKTSIAKVNGKEISWEDLDVRAGQWIKQLELQHGRSLTPDEVSAIKEYTKKTLVEQEALLAGISKQGFRVGDALVLEAVVQDPTFQENGSFSSTKYRELLSKSTPPLTDALYRERVRESLLLGQLQQGMLKTSFFLPTELDRIIALQEQKRDFDYFIVPVEKFLKDVSVDMAEIVSYYESHKTKFIEPEKVSVDYLELSVPNLMQQVVVTEEAKKQYYEDHITSYQTPLLIQARHILIAFSKEIPASQVKAKADKILNDLKSGKNFSELAKLYSDDEDSRKKGGDLGWFGAGEMGSVEFEKAAFALEKAGDISPLVSTQYGYHIVQLIDKKVAMTKPFEMVKDEVETHYRRQQAEIALNEKGDQLSELAFEHPSSLSEASALLSTSIQSSDFFTQLEGKGISEFDSVRSAAFSDEVLHNGNNSDLLRLNDETYVVLRIKQHQKAFQKTVEVVSKEIETKLKEEKAKARVLAFSEELMSELKNGSHFKDLANKNDFPVHEKKSVMRVDYDIEPQILKSVFSLAIPNTEENLTWGKFQLKNGDVLLAQLTVVKNGDHEKTPSTLKNAYLNQLTDVRGKLEYALLADLIVKEATITISK